MRDLRKSGGLPVTVGLLGAMLGARLATGPLLGQLPPHQLRRWGVSLDRLAAGEVHRLATSSLFSHDGAMFLRQLAFAGAVTGLHEAREGSGRTLRRFAIADIAGTALTLVLVIAPLARTKGRDDLRSTFDVGMSAGGFGLLGALMAGQRGGPALLGITAAGIGLKAVKSLEPIADAAHLISLAIGASLGRRRRKDR